MPRSDASEPYEVEHVGTLVESEARHGEAERRTHLLKQARQIRHTVFVEEQSISPGIEWDGLDDEAEHFVVWRETGAGRQALGTARLRVQNGAAKAERVAVRGEARGTGLGRVLMKAIEARARVLKLEEVHLHAQVAVERFYTRLGYMAYGDPFLEAEIAHRSMSLPLASKK
jgi:predicted GNAT family N-acyltransferase